MVRQAATQPRRSTRRRSSCAMQASGGILAALENSRVKASDDDDSESATPVKVKPSRTLKAIRVKQDESVSSKSDSSSSSSSSSSSASKKFLPINKKTKKNEAESSSDDDDSSIETPPKPKAIRMNKNDDISSLDEASSNDEDESDDDESEQDDLTLSDKEDKESDEDDELIHERNKVDASDEEEDDEVIHLSKRHQDKLHKNVFDDLESDEEELSELELAESEDEYDPDATDDDVSEDDIEAAELYEVDELACMIAEKLKFSKLAAEIDTGKALLTKSNLKTSGGKSKETTLHKSAIATHTDAPATRHESDEEQSQRMAKSVSKKPKEARCRKDKTTSIAKPSRGRKKPATVAAMNTDAEDADTSTVVEHATNKKKPAGRRISRVAPVKVKAVRRKKAAATKATSDQLKPTRRGRLQKMKPKKVANTFVDDVHSLSSEDNAEECNTEFEPETPARAIRRGRNARLSMALDDAETSGSLSSSEVSRVLREEAAARDFCDLEDHDSDVAANLSVNDDGNLTTGANCHDGLDLMALKGEDDCCDGIAMDADDENESVLMAQVLSDDDGVDDENIAMAEVCSDGDDDSLEASYISSGRRANFSSSPSAGQRSDSMQTSPEVTQPETEIRALDYLRSDDVISHDLKLRVTTPPSSPLLHESVVSTSRQVDSLAEEGPAAVETHEFDDHDMQLQALPDLALALVDAQQPAKLEQERLHDDVNAMNNEFETTARRGHVEMVNDGGVHLDHPRSFSSAVNDYQPIVCAETSDGAMAMSDSPCLEKSIDERVDSKPGFSAASPTEYHISDDVQSIHTQIPFQEKIDHNDFLAYLARNNQLLTESLVLVDGSEEAMETLSSNIGKSSHTISFLDQINNCRLLESLSEPAKFVDHENNQRLAATFRRAEDATNDQFAASNVSRNSSNDDVVRMVNCCAFATSNASGGISDDIDALNFVLQRCTLDAADDHSRAENLKTDFHLQETSTTGDHFGEKPSDPAFIMPLNNEDTSKSGSVGCEGSLSLHLLQEGEAEMTQVGSPDKATLLIEDAPLQEIDPPVPPCTVLCLNSNVPAGDSVSPIKSPRLVNFHKSVAWQANDQSTISANGNASLEISLSPSELFHKNSLYVSAESSQGVELTDKENCRPLQSSSLAENKSRRRREGSIMKWSLGTKIGSGAFGVVHIGMNTQTGSLLAIKIVALDDKVVKDVRSEINMLRSFKHVNIVQYLGAENVDGQLHIFQEWVAGGSITGMLVKFGAFPLAVVRNYLSQALEGLSYLHDHKIMHRDIKGANILVSDGGVVKLADFGASKELLNDMMLSHTMRGTPYFMAPEVFEEKYNFKADIWSIGCVGFQMFTANPPWKHFGTTNPVALFNKVKRHGGPPPLTTPASSLDIDIEVARFRALLERTFQFEPMERPSARDMLDDPFFLHSDNYLDDEHSTSYSLFSPCSIGSRGQRSPKGMNIESPAFPRQSVGRIKSGCPPRSPFLSPPLPKRQSLSVGSAMCSPKPDVAEWPTWAREHHGKACSPVAKRSAVAEMSFGSLGYSASTLDKTEASTATDSSSLAGVSFVLSK